MNIEQIHDYAISFDGVEVYQPFRPDNLVYKVNNKMFLLVATDTSPLQFNVKCNPDKAIELREQFEAVQPGYHMNKKHWNTIKIDGTLSTTLLKEFIHQSHDLVKHKK